MERGGTGWMKIMGVREKGSTRGKKGQEDKRFDMSNEFKYKVLLDE